MASGARIVAECKHYGAKRSGQDRQIFSWNQIYFHRNLRRYHTDAASQVPRCKALLNKYLKYLSITLLRHDIIFRLRVCSLTRIVNYSDDSASSGEGLAHNDHGRSKLQRVIGNVRILDVYSVLWLSRPLPASLSLVNQTNDWLQA
jgi:hypothetical protein